MPTYRYTGHSERIFLGLRRPDGSTVVLRHGETVTTAEAYEHRLLEPDKPKRPRKSTPETEPPDPEPASTEEQE